MTQHDDAPHRGQPDTAAPLGPDVDGDMVSDRDRDRDTDTGTDRAVDRATDRGTDVDRDRNTATADTAGDLDAPLDPAESLRIIAAQADKVRSTEVDGRVLFGVWGVAWLVGYLALYLTAEGTLPGGTRASDGLLLPAPWAYIVFAVLIWSAVGVTIGYTVRVSSGVQGVSARTGTLYGWSWFISFAGMGVVIGGLVRAGASDELVGLLSNSLACLIVGVLYLAGGTFWQDTRQYVLGIWIIAVAAIAVYARLPDAYLVMAVLGGGGFLLGAIGDHLLRAARRAGSARTVRSPR